MEPIALANTPEWHAERARGVGASEAAAACGLSRWMQPLTLWSNKVYGDTVEANDAMLVGQALEPFVAAKWLTLHGLTGDPAPGLFRHPDHPFMLASPDVLVSDGSLLECKTTSSRNADYGDEPPVEVIIQCQVQLAVMGRTLCHVACLERDTLNWREYTIDRSPLMIERLIARLGAFWQLVETREPPPVDWSRPDALEAIRSAYTRVDGETIELDAEIEEHWQAYLHHGEEIKVSEDMRDQHKARVLEALKTAERGILPSGGSVRRTLVKGGHVSYERKSYVKLTGAKQ